MNRAPLPSELPNHDRRRLLIGLAFLGTAAVAAARAPDQHIDYLGKGKLDEIIPKEIGGWTFETASGLVVPTEDQLSNALYSNLLTRVYTRGNEAPIMLLVAQSAHQTGVLQIHRPEVCYPAGGFTLSPITPYAIDIGARHISANSLDAYTPQRDEQILYWTRIGDHLPSSWAEQRIAVATDNLDGKIPDAALVRVSTIGMERGPAEEMLGGFVRAMLESMTPAGRRVLIGPAPR